MSCGGDWLWLSLLKSPLLSLQAWSGPQLCCFTSLPPSRGWNRILTQPPAQPTLSSTTRNKVISDYFRVNFPFLWGLWAVTCPPSRPLSPKYHENAGYSTLILCVWAYDCSLLCCGILKLSKYLGEKNEFEVLLLSNFVTPVPCNCQKFCCSFVPQQQFSSWVEPGFSASICIRKWKITSRDNFRFLALSLAFPELCSLWCLLFGWSLIPYIYYFCNWFSFSDFSQWEHSPDANDSISLKATILCRFQLSTIQALIGRGI